MTMEHRTDLIEAYALNALDEAERSVVEQHIAVCASCRHLARTSEDAVNMLSLVARPAQPPLRCKRVVMERIEREQFLTQPTPRRTQRRVPLASWAAAAAIAVAIVMSGWSFNLQRQLTAANAQISQMQAEMERQNTDLVTVQASLTQLMRTNEVLANGNPVCEMKNPETQAVAKCYARPGDSKAVMAVANLPMPQPGKVYQLWMAYDDVQAPLPTFVPHNGVASVEFEPPESWDRYTAIMVTNEDAGGATEPSEETVLAGEL